MPWADYQKSYRSVALQLRSKIPVGAELHRAEARSACRRRAALDYHAGIRTRPFDIAQARTPARCCSCRATRGTSSTARAPAGRKLADVGRPGDRAERYRLYRLAK